MHDVPFFGVGILTTHNGFFFLTETHNGFFFLTETHNGFYVCTPHLINWFFCLTLPLLFLSILDFSTGPQNF